MAGELRRLARFLPNTKILTLCGGQPFGMQRDSLQHATRLEGGDAHPLEAIITRMLLTKVKLEPEDEDVDEPTPENHEEKNDEGEKPQSITSIIKISLTVLVIGDFQQLLTVLELAVLIAPGHDVLRHHARQARHAG